MSSKRLCDINRVKRRKLRDERIRAMFNQLYNKERLRQDDVFKQVGDHWGLSETTIGNILRDRG